MSWSKFLLVQPGPALKFKLNDYFGGSFFVDEENKVAVVFEISDPHQHTAFVFGQAGYRLEPICESRTSYQNPILLPLYQKAL